MICQTSAIVYRKRYILELATAQYPINDFFFMVLKISDFFFSRARTHAHAYAYAYARTGVKEEYNII